jgi:hypothetical protein
LLAGTFASTLPMTRPPANPKVYHIMHVDRLLSVIDDGNLFCDAEMIQRQGCGTTIGMNKIKRRRLQLELESHPGLHVGECVPFYFCPRSVMLFLLYRGNDPDLSYQEGQGPIIHLELDLHEAVEWAKAKGLRWAVTLSNAGAFAFEDRCDLDDLDEIDWNAVAARDWRDPDVKHRKQAEFLIEHRVPWELVRRIGVLSTGTARKALAALEKSDHRPHVQVKTEWYY